MVYFKNTFFKQYLQTKKYLYVIKLISNQKQLKYGVYRFYDTFSDYSSNSEGSCLTTTNPPALSPQLV